MEVNVVKKNSLWVNVENSKNRKAPATEQRLFTNKGADLIVCFLSL